ncbi:MAG: hypothetical protein HQ596_04765 [Candidatus Saganbacteria bacterium]|nr:hypothetical protein [Candidatus Saganbacteria bacterium]
MSNLKKADHKEIGGGLGSQVGYCVSPMESGYASADYEATFYRPFVYATPTPYKRLIRGWGGIKWFKYLFKKISIGN